jgi:hypothetical protein
MSAGARGAVIGQVNPHSPGIRRSAFQLQQQMNASNTHVTSLELLHLLGWCWYTKLT